MAARILIIEPEADHALQLKIVFEEEGCLVEVARNGIEGLAKGISFQPDLVITEVAMKPLSGFEVASRIGAGEGFRAPVIFYTSFFRDEKARQEVILRYGAAHYFFKPYQAEALRKAAMGILSQVGETAEPPAIAFQQPLSQAEETRHPNESVWSAGNWSVSPQEIDISKEATDSPLPVESLGWETRNRQTHRDREDSLAIEQVMGEAVLPPPKRQTQFSHTTDPPVSMGQATPQEREFVKARPKPYSSGGLDTASFSAAKTPSSSKTVLVVAGVFFILSGLLVYVYYLSTLRTVTQPISSAVPAPSLSPQPTSQPSAQAPEKEGIAPEQQPASAASTAFAGSSERESVHLADRLLMNTRPQGKQETKENEGKTSEMGRTSESSMGRKDPPTILISDVSGKEPIISVVRSKRPPVTPEILRSSSQKALVIRVIVDRSGKVVDAQPLNLEPRTEALNKAVMSAIYDWEFSRSQGSETTVTKYFSFQVSTLPD